MENGQPFGSWSLAATGATLLLAQEFHPMVIEVLRAGLNAAWLAMLLSGLLAATLYWAAAKSVGARPGGNLISLAREAAGTPGAALCGLAVSGMLLYHCGFVLRETAEMTVSSLYPHTPQTFAIVALLLSSLYGAYGRTDSLVKLSRILLPLLLLGVLVILVGAMGWGRIRFLLPFWGPGPLPLVARSVPLVGVYTPVLFLLICADRLRDPEQLARAGVVAILANAFVTALTKIVLVMAYPMPLGFEIPFPLHEMSRLVVGGRFFQRIEGIWLYLWVITTGCFLAALLHAAAKAFTEAFGLPEPRVAVLPMVSAALTIAFFPPDQGRTLTWHALGTPFGAAVTFGLPLVLVPLAAMRRRRVRREA